MERGEGFRRRRAIEREIEEQHDLQSERRQRRLLESGEKSDEKLETKSSEAITKIRIREILDSLEEKERASTKLLTAD